MKLEKNGKIYIAGRHGLVGSAIERVLVEQGFTNIIGKRHTELGVAEGVDGFEVAQIRVANVLGGSQRVQLLSSEIPVLITPGVNMRLSLPCTVSRATIHVVVSLQSSIFYP